MSLFFRRILNRTALALGLIALIWSLSAPMVSAQDLGEKPVMQNTFFNVIWGSAMGALLGAASASLSAGDSTKPDNLRDEVLTGATYGGVLGLGLGIYLTFSGISFDPDRSVLFAGSGSPTGGNQMLARQYTPPIQFESAPGKPFRITGVKALLLDWRF